jgi:hypothetical protein
MDDGLSLRSANEHDVGAAERDFPNDGCAAVDETENYCPSARERSAPACRSLASTVSLISKLSAIHKVSSALVIL